MFHLTLNMYFVLERMFSQQYIMYELIKAGVPLPVILT